MRVPRPFWGFRPVETTVAVLVFGFKTPKFPVTDNVYTLPSVPSTPPAKPGLAIVATVVTVFVTGLKIAQELRE
jgi:hypothetical protein